MDEFERAALEENMRLHVGPGGRYFLYDRSEANAMTFVLDLAERHLKTGVHLYWIPEGLPEYFCLPSFSVAAVGFGERYILFANRLRKLFDSPLVEGNLEDVAARMCLRNIAEFALRDGNIDLAVAAFARSVLDQSIVFPDTRLMLLELSDAPIDEAYVFLWFYGLLHELGHFAPPSPVHSEVVSDENLLKAMRSPPGSPEGRYDWERCVAAATADPPNPFLSLTDLRREVLADIFATAMMWQAARRLMRKERQAFRAKVFAAEAFVFFHILALLQRSRLTATAAARPDHTASDNIQFQQVAIGVRLGYVSSHLSAVLAAVVAGGATPGVREFAYAKELLDDVNDFIMQRILQINHGVVQAMRFALFPQQREPDLLARLMHESASSPVLRLENESFLSVADRFGRQSPELAALRSVIANEPGTV